MRHRITTLAFASLMGLSAACLVSCAPGGASGSPTCPYGKIAFGVEPYENPKALEAAYKTIADDLTKKMDCPVKVQIVEDYSAEVLAMRNGSLVLGQFGPLGYVFADEKAGAEPLVSFGDAEGKLSSYTAGIWAKKSSGIHDVASLRGKQLALGGVGSTSGDALPRKAVKDAGLSDKDLTMDYAGGHPEALMSLTNGAVDAAEINSQTLATAISEGRFQPDDYVQIWKSDPIPNDPITVSKKANPELKRKLRTALTQLDPSTVKKVAGYLDVDPPGPLVRVTKQDYSALFELSAALGLTTDDVMLGPGNTAGHSKPRLG
ncbi:phosphate/phosphite/phosphonate ABC transporter substrate-binding protein [Corynebacterium parakroppenstedtii]|uniref:phosphate/phosphite/phosphonate ABC transporter substrate-binding protein n=1 Tax=Corynebacterium parakroppenstedtii TaxID=2828363 RepID=UPI0030B9A2A3